MPNSFGERLKQLRKSKGLNQSQLAEILGVHEITVRRWELEQREPRLEDIKALAKALGISEAELLNDTHDNNSWTINIRCVAEFKDEVINLKKNVSPVTDIAAGPAGCTFTITAPWEKLKSVDGLKELCDLIIGSYPVIESNGIFVGALPKKKGD